MFKYVNNRPIVKPKGKKLNCVCGQPCFVPVTLNPDPLAVHPDYDEPYFCDLNFVLYSDYNPALDDLEFWFYCNNTIEEVSYTLYGGNSPLAPFISSDRRSFRVRFSSNTLPVTTDSCITTNYPSILTDPLLDSSRFDIKIKACGLEYTYRVLVTGALPL
jgi:hypothetical protein